MPKSPDSLEDRIKRAIKDTCDDKNWELATVLEEALEELSRRRECDDCPIPRCTCEAGFELISKGTAPKRRVWAACCSCNQAAKVYYQETPEGWQPTEGEP